MGSRSRSTNLDLQARARIRDHADQPQLQPEIDLGQDGRRSAHRDVAVQRDGSALGAGPPGVQTGRRTPGGLTMDAEIAEREGDVGGDLHIAISQEWTNISVKYVMGGHWEGVAGC